MKRFLSDEIENMNSCNRNSPYLYGIKFDSRDKRAKETLRSKEIETIRSSVVLPREKTETLRSSSAELDTREYFRRPNSTHESNEEK